MANRFPLTINTTNSTIEELPAGDNLDLSGSNISNVGAITATGNVSGSYILGNGSQLTGITTSPSGSNTQVQFNDAGSFGSSANLTFDKTTNTLSTTNLTVNNVANLGNVANIEISGGSNGQVLTTDGLGNLSFTTVQATSYTLMPVKSMSVTAITLTGTKSIDGVAWNVGDRVLLTGQGNQNENGIWIVASSNWSRATDFTTGASTFIGGVLIPVLEGTIYGGTLWQCSNSGTLNVNDPINFIRQGIDGIISVGTSITGVASAGTGLQSLAIGDTARATTPYSLAIGLNANASDSYTTSIGTNSKAAALGSTAYGVGANAAGVRSIVIGEARSSGENGIAVGYLSNVSNSNSISIGSSAGNTGQQAFSTAIGWNAGRSSQGTYGVGLGAAAGNISQGAYAVGVGYMAGNNTQGTQSVAIGRGSGTATQGANSVAVGVFAGASNQGANSIAIGANAGFTNQANNTIILNATGANLDQTTANTFTVKPVRSNSTGNLMYYDTTTGEITYSSSVLAKGSNTEIQFNDDGFANGQSSLTYNKTTQTLTGNIISARSYTGLSASQTWAGGTVGLDLNRSYVYATVSASTTFTVNTVPVTPNTWITIIITTSGTGTYTMTWPSGFKFYNNVNQISSGTSGAISMLKIFYTGSEYLCEMYPGYV